MDDIFYLVCIQKLDFYSIMNRNCKEAFNPIHDCAIKKTTKKLSRSGI